ncbi:MAG: hypothetical protein K2W97_05175 [Chthoniobacterales bacterium]|nr:hypothetical protein [Chthoniobacterales bacterium]
MNWFLSIVLLFLSFATARSQADTGVRVVVSPSVTIGQYLTFLKAAASRSDSHELYSSNMECQIISNESSWGNKFYYFVANGASADQMLIGYNIMQERRYCNWIEHGSPENPAEAEASTETGSYDLTGPEVVINRDAKHHLHEESGNTFAITTTVNNDSPQEDGASPLAMFRWGGSEEKKKEAPQDKRAALRRESEGSSTELVLRGNPLSGNPLNQKLASRSNQPTKNSKQAAGRNE